MTRPTLAEVRAVMRRIGDALPDDRKEDLLLVHEVLSSVYREVQPGGPLPDPWPGMVVEFTDGERHTVAQVYPRATAAADIEEETKWGPRVRWGAAIARWHSLAIREVRDVNGRVLWRAS